MSRSQVFTEQPEKGLFILPGGIFTQDGNCHRDVELKPLTGREEEIITEKDDEKLVAPLLTQILQNCIKRIGPIKEIDSELVQNLLIADRDYLLLCLRRLTFGNKVDARVHCPNEKCGELLDISFNIKDLKVSKKKLGNGIYSVTLSQRAAYRDENNVMHNEIEFTLPVVGDQEEAAKIYYENESRALTTLFARCIKRIGSITEINEDLISSMSILARREIESKMKEHSPNVDLDIKVSCPECGLQFKSPFDVHNFFLKN